jgi:hypothetical protein
MAIKRTVATATIAAALLFGASEVSAQSSEQRWNFTFGGGTAPSVNGIYHEGGSGTVLTLPTRVGERNWSDIYNGGFSMRAGIGYLAGERTEITGAFTYLRQDIEQISVGTVASFDLRSDFGEYRDWGLEGGVRWHFAPDAVVNPYIGVAAGARWIEAMPATFRVPAANVVLSEVPFYDEAVVPTFGGDFGVQFRAGERVRFGVEAGLRWIGDIKDVDGLAGTGLENLNDTSSRWVLPILGTLSVRF